MSSFEKFINTFDSDKKGKQFEKFVVWFLKKNPEWSSRIKKIWLWDDFPKRWGRDKGIDIVFKDKDNKLCAVQAKCYDQNYSINKSDVDKFLSESNRKLIDYRLLISTTDKLNKNADDVCRNQEKTVIKFLFSNFEKSKFNYPKNYSLINKAKIIKKPKPYPHQKIAIKKVIDKFKKNDRGQLIMACGTGKTFTSLWIKERLKSKKTIVFVPSLSLLSQTLKEWCYASKKIENIICVCSDKSVSKKISDDENIQTIKDLSFPVTSEINDIKNFLNKNGDKIIFSTYQSSDLIVKCFRNNKNLEIDLIIADEAHRCVGKKGDLFVPPLDNKLIKSKKRLFTTATPKCHSKNIKKISQDMGIEIYSMDDEKYFGKIFHKLTFGKAIENKLLSDYQVVIPVINNSYISKIIGKRVLLKNINNRITDAKSFATQIAVIKTLKQEKVTKSITFHNRIDNAKKFSKEIIDTNSSLSKNYRLNGKIYSDFVQGRMSAYDRRVKINQLKDLDDYKYGILSNARCLQEGVDIPTLDGIAFIDPRSSHIDIVQAVGRAIRSSKKKTKGTIVVPVFKDQNDKDFIKNIDESGFKHVFDVLNALRDHDETLSFELDNLRTELGKREGKYNINNIKKVKFDFPSDISLDFIRSIKTETIIQTSQDFNYFYGLLKNFEKQHNHLRVPPKYKTKDGASLGRFVNDCRTRYQGTRGKSRLISKDRIELLEQLKNWTWNPWEDDWNEGYKNLLEYIVEKGNSNIKQSFITQDGYTLGRWISRQRTNYKDKTLHKSKIKSLEKIKGWSWNKSIEEFEYGFNQLLKFVKKYKHTNITDKFKDEDGYKLGAFVKGLRTSKKYSHKHISKERIKRFEKIDEWFWDKTETYNITAMKSFEKYYKKTKNVLVNVNYVDLNGFKLGVWVNSMRAQSNRREGKVSKVIKDFFKKYAGWDINKVELEWNMNYEKLTKFFDKNGHTNATSKDTVEGLKLDRWIVGQRSRFNGKKKPPLNKKQIALLNKINVRLNYLR